jgi:hypothetical protein
MKPGKEHSKTAIYLLLLAIQIFGAIFFVWQELPEFKQVLVNPGEQLPKDARSDAMMLGVFFRHAGLVLEPPALHPNTVPASERIPQSFFSVSGPPQLYFWQRIVLRRRFQASSGTGPRYRLPSDGSTRIPVRRLPVRAVLHQS